MLSKSQAATNGSYIDFGGDVDAIFLQIGFSSREGESFLRTLQDARPGFAGFLHVRLRYLTVFALFCWRQARGSAVNVFLSSLRCACDKLACASLL